MKRRHFLQFSGSTLATLGLSQLQTQQQALAYGRQLAQDTSRKLALLVGVNRYPESARFFNLTGATTDVEMQRQLLISRFKFHPNDICIVSDEADLLPTRDNILTAFEEHLINQAKPGDIVVFHFSGHGSRVLDPDPIHADDLNSTFVPGDATGDADYVDDIMGRTLFLLMSALETEQVGVVLDSCYSGGGTRGNIRIRAADGGNIFQPSDRELSFQNNWISRLEAKGVLDRSSFLQRRGLGVAKGVVLAASQRDEPAAEVAFDGFEAGAFTYLLTQFLFQQADSVQSTIARIRPDVRQVADQLPVLEIQPERSFETAPLYFVEAAEQVPPAEAVLTDGVDGTLWLGGVHPNAIAAYRQGTTLIPASGGPPLVITERKGLIARVESPLGLAANTTLREAARIIPVDLTLAIGLDPSLGADMAQAQAYLDGLPMTTAVLPTVEGTYGTEIHYILGRMTPAYRAYFGDHPDLPPINALGLFSQTLGDWVPGSFAAPTDSLRSALLDLGPRMISLLAVRMVTLSLNAQASPLGVSAQVVATTGDRVVAAARAGRGTTSADRADLYTLKTNEPLQIRVTHAESVPLHVGVLGIFPSGNFKLLYPPNVSRQAAALPPGRALRIPDPAVQSDLVIENPGLYEVVVLASPRPFNRALQNLDAVANSQRAGEVAPDEDLSGFNGLFENLETPRQGEQAVVSQRLKADTFAALSLRFEVLEDRPMG